MAIIEVVVPVTLSQMVR